MASLRKHLVTCFMLAGLVLSSSLNAWSAELIMLEQKHCPWCERWHEEIGSIYPKTEEGRIAPLRVVNIHDEIPSDLKDITISRFTPTFILMREGNEIGRIRGYTGDEFFWVFLSEIFDKLPEDSRMSKSKQAHLN